MTAEEVNVKIVTARLQNGGPLPYIEVFRDEIIRSAIKEARPTPLFKWLSVCPINRAAIALGVTDYRETEAYRLLLTFHCVDYFSIPREIRRRIPELIREVLKAGGR